MEIFMENLESICEGYRISVQNIGNVCYQNKSKIFAENI